MSASGREGVEICKEAMSRKMKGHQELHQVQDTAIRITEIHGLSDPIYRLTDRHVDVVYSLGPIPGALEKFLSLYVKLCFPSDLLGTLSDDVGLDVRPCSGIDIWKIRISATG